MGSYIIKEANPDDAQVIMQLVDVARRTMHENGNPDQWPVGYPSSAVIDDDLQRGDCYIVCDTAGKVVGSFVFRQGPDPSYGHIYEGKWLDDSMPYYVIHRVTSLPAARGVFSAIVSYCIQHSDNLHIDTHRDNHIMRHLVEKYGFTYCGIIHLSRARGAERLAYQLLSRNVCKVPQ